MVAGWLAHVAIAPPLRSKGVVVEIEGDNRGKRRKGGRRLPVSHQSLADQPCLASTQSLLSSSTSLAAIMLTRLTKSIKSKANFFHPFPKFFLFLFFETFRFYIMQ
jgi:hypothetical protein